MKTAIIMGGIVLLILFSIAGCEKGNEEINAIKDFDDAPQAIVNSTLNSKLPLRTYVASYVVEGDGEVSSILILYDNNEFSLSGNEYISYIPSGKYRTDNDRLFLAVTDDEIYVFIIGDDKLTFESGTWLENWVEQGTIFYLKSE
jgi:hypothetical protein